MQNQGSAAAMVDHRFTVRVVIGMFLGIGVGLLVQYLPMSASVRHVLIKEIFETGGEIFLNIIKMLVVPIVLVSLVCGSSALGSLKKFGRIGIKTLLLYLLTTMIAVTVALSLASLFHVGQGVPLGGVKGFTAPSPPTVKALLVGLVTDNPFRSLVDGNMLQIIVFSILFGVAITVSGEAGKKVAEIFNAFNKVLMRLIVMIMSLAPYGVFFLLAGLFGHLHISHIVDLLEFAFVVVLVLLIQMVGCYGFFLVVFARLNPLIFFKKMYSAMLFAFNVSSSAASIPVVLRTVEDKLGVKNSVASFVIPLGATLNMDGTAIMQGVATVFIANAYGVHLGLVGYITVILMATLISVGTAAVPSAGLITLAVVLQQVGLPVTGIGLIFAIDRLLDMARTAVNISGDSMVACVVGKSEGALDETIYSDRS